MSDYTTDAQLLSDAAAMVGIGGIVYEVSRHRHLFVTDIHGPVITVMAGDNADELNATGASPSRPWETHEFTTVAPYESEGDGGCADKDDDNEPCGDCLVCNADHDDSVDWEARFLADGRSVADLVAEAEVAPALADSDVVTLRADQLTRGMWVDATDETHGASGLSGRNALTGMVFFDYDAERSHMRWALLSDDDHAEYPNRHGWSFTAERTFALRSDSPVKPVEVTPSVKVGDVIRGPEALTAVGVGGRIESNQSGRVHTVVTLPGENFPGEVARDGNRGDVFTPSTDITWTVVEVATPSAVEVAEAADVEATPKTRTIPLRDVTVGMFVIPTDDTIRRHGIRRGRYAFTTGFTVESRDDDVLRWNNNGRDGRTYWYWNRDDTFEVVVYTDAELAAWLVAEAQNAAAVAIADAKDRLDAEREAFHEARNAIETRHSATARTAMAERNAFAARVDEVIAERDKLQKLWTPGGIVNKVACMRGDLTSQCSELDRTLRGIGWYDRDGLNAAGETLPEAITMGRGWYRSYWDVTVPSVTVIVNGNDVTLSNVVVKVSSGDAYRASRNVEPQHIAEAVNKILGTSIGYHDVRSYDSCNESNVVASEGSYSVADYTD